MAQLGLTKPTLWTALISLLNVPLPAIVIAIPVYVDALMALPE